jgi:selenocysteine lyase/cysteine desulfurase
MQRGDDMNHPNGLLLPHALQEKCRAAFCLVDTDENGKKRLFFDNSGGALRLAKCVEAKSKMEMLPDCPERTHEKALELRRVVEDGTRELLEVVFGAKEGAILTELTASQAMFHLIEIVLENTEGGNAVVSAVEHPSAFDAVAYYCERTGKELRVVYPDKETGQITPGAVAALVDQDTRLVSVMSASNVTGSVMDIPGIVQAVKAINPDAYLISDAVQHAPHMALDVAGMGLDGSTFAPYKFFGVRGCGFGYASPRLAALTHRKLLQKPQEVFALGTPAPGNFAAAHEIVTYVCEIGRYFSKETDTRALFCEGMHRIHLHERALLHRLLEGSEKVPGLRHIEGVTVYTDTADLTRRDLIAAIGIEGLDFSECVKEYEKRGVIVCDRVLGSMYARRILEALDLPGAVRVSPLHCHNEADIDEFLRVTAAIASAVKSK